MLKEKLLKLKQLGVDVQIKDLTQSDLGCNYNKLKIDPNLTEIEVDKLIDEKIKFIEDRPWINEIQSMKDCSYNICLLCKSYTFVLQDYFAGETTIENCSIGHFQKIARERHKPITICNDYQLKK